ncbi:hypothetical protein GQ600_20363 [Phytophthora cactorum]|nr:hypothetical protein GQ600_20363 [Phytophthora cactorum]
MDLPAPGFEISSPIRARGRPKQKAKVNKAKKCTSIRMAKADSILHDKQLSLQTISDIVWHDTTYTNCAELLRQFQVFEKKMKPPVAHIIANLPTTKSIMAPAHISRILSKALLQRANKKVMTLQKKNRALAERDVGVEFPGLVVIGGQSLMSMRRWHQAIDALNRLDRTKKWIAELDFSQFRETHLLVKARQQVGKICCPSGSW